MSAITWAQTTVGTQLTYFHCICLIQKYEVLYEMILRFRSLNCKRISQNLIAGD